MLRLSLCHYGWFKSFDNTFTLVLVTALDYIWDAKVMNGLQVTITLREFVPFKVFSGNVTPTVMDRLTGGVL